MSILMWSTFVSKLIMCYFVLCLLLLDGFKRNSLMIGLQFGLGPRILGFKHPLVDLTFQIEDWFLKLGGYFLEWGLLGLGEK